nr:hypothetical protein [Tanacetum cinerariifolium]
GVRPGAVGGQHGGVIASPGRPWPARLLQRPHRGRLAGGGRPGDGADAGAAAGARRSPRRQKHRQSGHVIMGDAGLDPAA